MKPEFQVGPECGNTLDHLIHVNLCCLASLSSLGYLEAVGKDGLWVGGWFHKNDAMLWLNIANVPNSLNHLRFLKLGWIQILSFFEEGIKKWHAGGWVVLS